MTKEFATSDFTLTTLKQEVMAQREDVSSLTDNIFLRALNRALVLYQKEERNKFPDRFIAYSGLKTITSSGLLLSTAVTDCSNFDNGFDVCNKGSSPTDSKFDQNNIMNRVSQGDLLTWQGYEIRGDGKIYIVPENTQSIQVVFRYFKKPTLFSLTSPTWADQIPVDRDIDDAMVDFILSYFYKAKGIEDFAQDYETQFRQKVVEFFASQKSRAIIYPSFI